MIMVRFFAAYGLRLVMIVGVIMAITSTFGYAFSESVYVWLFFRIGWGLAFSTLRIGTIGYALEYQKQGLALGISKSLQEAGPMAVLFLAPILLAGFQPRDIFFLLTACSLPALFFVLRLPSGANTPTSTSGIRLLRWPSTFNAITFISAVVIDGIIVIVLGVLFIRYRENISIFAATSLAAFYLGYRRICLVMLSFAGGWLADKIGLDKVFNFSMTCVIAGLIIILTGWIASGAVMVFTFYAINAAISPATATKGQKNCLEAVAENATWRDLGAALGTLFGGLLLMSQHLTGIISLAVFVLAFLLFLHTGVRLKRSANGITFYISN
jgi:MFS family permease